MRLIKLLKLSDLFGITLLLVLFTGCATTGDLNLVKNDLVSMKKEMKEVKEKNEKLENLSFQILYNLMEFMKIYNNHIKEYHQLKINFN